jgi:hypothetical protein
LRTSRPSGKRADRDADQKFITNHLITPCGNDTMVCIRSDLPAL